MYSAIFLSLLFLGEAIYLRAKMTKVSPHKLRRIASIFAVIALIASIITASILFLSNTDGISLRMLCIVTCLGFFINYILSKEPTESGLNAFVILYTLMTVVIISFGNRADRFVKSISSDESARSV
jgi:DNA integrity scanning protein DisA with diadenylate cyclase activity